MKTLRTADGTFTLSEDQGFMGKLQEIIAAHRAYLIDCKIKLLEMYIEYRFNRRLNPEQLQDARRNLIALKHSPINLKSYPLIMDQVERYSFVDLSNTIFYEEIDNRLKAFLNQTEINFTSTRKTLSLNKLLHEMSINEAIPNGILIQLNNMKGKSQNANSI